MERNGDDHDTSRAPTAPGEHYVLKLFVTGLTRRSQQAIAMIKALCEERLAGRYELDIVDMYQHPGELKEEQIVASPTLLRKQPLPLRRLVGDLGDRERVLAALGLSRLA